MQSRALLLSSALALSWLGPHWHVPIEFVLLGSALLFSFLAASVLAPEAAGAWPWRRGLLLVPLGALVFGGPWFPWGHQGWSPVLVEVFLPPQRHEGKGAGGFPSLRGLERWASGTEEDLLFPVLLDLREAAARERLGRLSGRGGPLSKEDVSRVDAPVTFVSGRPLSRLESLEDAVAREMSRGADSLELSEMSRREAGAIRLQVDSPSELTFQIYLLSRAEEAGLEGGWWRVTEIVQPARAEAASVRGTGERPARLRQDLEFPLNASRPGMDSPSVRLLVAFAGASIAGVKLLR